MPKRESDRRVPEVSVPPVLLTLRVVEPLGVRELRTELGLNRDEGLEALVANTLRLAGLQGLFLSEKRSANENRSDE